MWTQNYFAILPSSVRYDDRLEPKAKLLYATLYSLAQSDGVVYAGNKYLAQTTQCSARTIIRYINDLVIAGHISYKFEYKPGTKEISRRLLYISPQPPLLAAAQGQALAAVIPSHVLVSDVSAMAKLLYAEISAATPTDGYCTRSSAEFAELLHAGEPTVRRWLKELTDAELVRAEMEYREGGRRIRRRRLYLVDISPCSAIPPDFAPDGSNAPAPCNESNGKNVTNSPICGQNSICSILSPPIKPMAPKTEHARKKRQKRRLRQLKKTVALLL